MDSPVFTRRRTAGARRRDARLYRRRTVRCDRLRKRIVVEFRRFSDRPVDQWAAEESGRRTRSRARCIASSS